MLDALPPDPPSEVIMVTGKALPQPKADQAHHVDILGARDIRDTPAQALDAILARVPGLQLFRRSDSTSGHPTSQGVTLRALGGNASSRALLILDGVPQTDPFGGWVNWPAYDPAGLAEARVVRGGGSVSQGPGALAGVIELSSLTQPGLNAFLEAGSRQSLRGHAFWGAELAGGLLTIDGQGGRGDGFVPVTKATRGPVDQAAQYREGSLRARWTIPVRGSVELQAGGLAFADDRDRGLPFTSNRTRGADASVRLVGRGHWQWSALAYAQWRGFESSFASVDDERTSAARVAFQDQVPSRGVGGAVEVRPGLGGGFGLRVGADLRSVRGQSRELFAYSGGEATRRRVSGGVSDTAGLFAETSFERGPWTLNAGVRVDHWRIADGRLIERPLGGVPTRDDMYPRRTGTEPTARASLVYNMTSHAAVRLAAYSGWRPPSLNELFRPFRAGPDATAANPLLDPERLKGIEAGVHFDRGPLDVDMTLFANRLSNAIANVTLGHGPGTFPGVGFVAGDFRQRRNLDAIGVRGVEISAGVRRGAWSLRIGGSLTDAEVDSDGDAAALDGLRPAQTPNLVVTGALGWEDGNRSASLLFRYAGSQFEDDLNRQRLPSATTVDAFVAWPVGRRLQLIARAQNLLDEEVVAGNGDDGSVERATPRTLWIGLRFGFDGSSMRE